MSVEPQPSNAPDHQFGLPKPDFQSVPPKKPIGPLATLTALLVMFVAIGKIIYHVYHTPGRDDTHPKIEEQITPQETEHPLSDTLPHPPLPQKEVTHINDIKDDDTNHEVFGKQKHGKKKENIQAVQERLEAEESNPKPLVKPGTYQELSTPQGIYHIVVYNHLRKHKALYRAQQLTKKNLGVCLVIPNKGEKYYRVTIAQSRTQYEADEKLKKLKTTYPNSFILKY